jgi:hypothetical protein
LPQHVSRFLHALIAASAAFADSRFKSAGVVGEFAGGDLLKQTSTVADNRSRVDQAAGHQHNTLKTVAATIGKMW